MSNAPFDLILTGGVVLLEGGLAERDVAVRDGRIAAIVKPGTASAATRILDIAGRHLLPGILDVHFHVRAPSYPERGTVLSETRAAAAGGVTTIFEMPISKPCCNSAEILSSRRDHFASDAIVNFALYGAPGAADREGVKAMVNGGRSPSKYSRLRPRPAAMTNSSACPSPAKRSNTPFCVLLPKPDACSSFTPKANP